MTWEEYRNFEAGLTLRQSRWLGHKANWEGMTRWAVVNEGWPPPLHEQLCNCGSNLPCRCRATEALGKET